MAEMHGSVFMIDKESRKTNKQMDVSPLSIAFLQTPIIYKLANPWRTAESLGMPLIKI